MISPSTQSCRRGTEGNAEGHFWLGHRTERFFRVLISFESCAQGSLLNIVFYRICYCALIKYLIVSFEKRVYIVYISIELSVCARDHCVSTGQGIRRPCGDSPCRSPRSFPAALVPGGCRCGEGYARTLGVGPQRRVGSKRGTLLPHPASPVVLVRRTAGPLAQEYSNCVEISVSMYVCMF